MADQNVNLIEIQDKLSDINDQLAVMEVAVAHMINNHSPDAAQGIACGLLSIRNELEAIRVL